jgi:uncharacterized protein (DUF1778 family)
MIHTVMPNWHHYRKLRAWFQDTLAKSPASNRYELTGLRPAAINDATAPTTIATTERRKKRLYRQRRRETQTRMTTKTTIERGRITARVPQPVVDELEEAAALVGVTVNQFIVKAATERARAVIETYTRIDLSRPDAAFILQLLHQPALANHALQRIGQRCREAMEDEQDRLHPTAGRARH